MIRIIFSIVFLIFLILEAHSQTQILIEDKSIPGTDTVWLFTPEPFNKMGTYPIVYMLHGYSSNYRQWHEIMDAQKYADDYQMIIVCPDGFYNSWYFDSPNKINSQFAEFFFEKLMPVIEKNYPIDPENRFITGLSMGGHGAFHLFLKRPDAFRSAGSTSGVMDLRGSAGAYELADHLGELEPNKDLWLSFSAVGNIHKFKEAGKELIFNCGTEDPFYKWNKDLYQMFLENKLQATFISQPGEHDRQYWKKSIKSHFEFFNAKVVH